MSAVYKNPGDLLWFTPTGNIASGDVVAISDNLVGVAFEPIAANTRGALNTYGEYDVTITAGTAIDVGDLVTVPAVTSAGVATTCVFGPAVEAASATATTVRARLVRDRVIVANEG